VGVLKRLNVGVVLDDWQKTGADGKVTTTPMSDTDIKRFTQLVRESIGLKDDRGDQLNVLNQAFKSNAPLGPVDGLPLWQTAVGHQLAKQIVGAGLVLLVAFLVLRPLMKSLTKIARRPRPAGEAKPGSRGRPREPVGTGRQGHQARPVSSSRSPRRARWSGRIRSVPHRS
jgi:flagellar M-ring protein FliF